MLGHCASRAERSERTRDKRAFATLRATFRTRSLVQREERSAYRDSLCPQVKSAIRSVLTAETTNYKLNNTPKKSCASPHYVQHNNGNQKHIFSLSHLRSPLVFSFCFLTLSSLFWFHRSTAFMRGAFVFGQEDERKCEKDHLCSLRTAARGLLCVAASPSGQSFQISCASRQRGENPPSVTHAHCTYGTSAHFLRGSGFGVKSVLMRSRKEKRAHPEMFDHAAASVRVPRSIISISLPLCSWVPLQLSSGFSRK